MNVGAHALDCVYVCVVRVCSECGTTRLSGHKVQKNRIISVLVSPHNLPLVCVGRYANPRCFKNCDQKLVGQIINIVTEEQRESTDAIDDKGSQIPTPPAVLINEAIEGLQLFMEWNEILDEIDAINLMHICQMLVLSKTMKHKNLRQQRLDVLAK